MNVGHWGPFRMVYVGSVTTTTARRAIRTMARFFSSTILLRLLVDRQIDRVLKRCHPDIVGVFVESMLYIIL